MTKFKVKHSLFFDLWNMTLVNGYMISYIFNSLLYIIYLLSLIVYDKLTQKKLFHLDFQVIVTKSLISNYDNFRRNPQTTRCSCRSFPTEIPSHLLGLKPNRCKCHYCKNQGKEHRTFVKCNTFGVFLCLVDSASG